MNSAVTATSFYDYELNNIGPNHTKKGQGHDMSQPKKDKSRGKSSLVEADDIWIKSVFLP